MKKRNGFFVRPMAAKAALFVLGAALLAGCGGGGKAGAQSGEDVYVAGYEADAEGKTAACYWKNGVQILLASDKAFSSAAAITVSGGFAYVAGYEADWIEDDMGFIGPGNRTACYWKNGNQIKLSGGRTDAVATAIAVSGDDVYVAGHEYDGNGSPNRACYWKNGRRVALPGGSVAAAIAVSGDNVYVAGWELDLRENMSSTACYWKNDGKTALRTDENIFVSQANAIAVSGDDVYVAGREGNPGGDTGACYWKNNSKTALSGSEARSIAVSGAEVYVGGAGGYWKNGKKTELPGGGAAAAIAVSGKDVYAAGGAGGYWKNGKETALPASGVGKTAASAGIAVIAEAR